MLWEGFITYLVGVNGTWERALEGGWIDMNWVGALLLHLILSNRLLFFDSF